MVRLIVITFVEKSFTKYTSNLIFPCNYCNAAHAISTLLIVAMVRLVTCAL